MGSDDLGIGIVLFVEGEEEYGSRSFANFLDAHADDMRSDVIVVADSGNLDSETPALTVSLRGNAKFHLTVRTLDHASHSGMFGGAVPDAMMAATTLIATLWDENGSVAVDGLAVRDAETADYSEAQLREETGLLDGVRPIGDGSLLGRIWNKPTVTVTGIDFTSVASASNTLSPEVTMVLSCRVAPGAVLGRRVRRPRAPPARARSVRCAPELLPTSTSATACSSTPADGRSRPRAVRSQTDTGAQPSTTASADPFRSSRTSSSEFPGAQILVTGVEDPHSRAHSPNESLHIDTFRNAIRSEALLLARLNRRALSL